MRTLFVFGFQQGAVSFLGIFQGMFKCMFVWWPNFVKETRKNGKKFWKFNRKFLKLHSIFPHLKVIQAEGQTVKRPWIPNKMDTPSIMSKSVGTVRILRSESFNFPVCTCQSTETLFSFLTFHQTIQKNKTKI